MPLEICVTNEGSLTILIGADVRPRSVGIVCLHMLLEVVVSGKALLRGANWTNESRCSGIGMSADARGLFMGRDL